MSTRRGDIPRLRPWSGARMLSYGFRPFFLGAGVWGFLALLLWLLAFSHGVVPPTALAPVSFHVHELLFGFAIAAVAGFLLTAVPNWTGRMPLTGLPLLGLVLTWLLGRAAMLGGAWIGPWPAAVLELCFPALLLAVIAREVVAGRNWRNLPPCAALATLLAADLLIMLEMLELAPTARVGERLGIATLALLVSLIGGRIVPSFTTNWLKKHRPGVVAAPFGGLDKAIMAGTLLALLGWVLLPESGVVGAALVLAGLGNAVRLARWQGHRTLGEPLLAVLHLGYAWLALGLVLIGRDALIGYWGEHLHALTIGCFTTMIFAVMTRATLGHTGRDLVAGPATTAIFVAISAAAILRVAAHGLPGDYLVWIALAGLSWLLAFGLFLVIYGPMLLGPRADGRPG